VRSGRIVSYADEMNALLTPRKTVQLHEFTTGLRTDLEPVCSLIVLHGLGSDASRLAAWVRQLDLDLPGPARCLLPHAPVRTISLNGTDMQAWYDARPPEPRLQTPQPSDEAGLRASQCIVQALIDREVARGMPSERIALVGFSQGAVLALHTALRAPQTLAGVAVLSGYLPLTTRIINAEASLANQRLPVFLAHGENDEVVGMDRGRAARTALQAMGRPVDWHRYPMGHEWCDAERLDLQAWLRRCLARALP